MDKKIPQEFFYLTLYDFQRRMLSNIKRLYQKTNKLKKGRNIGKKDDKKPKSNVGLFREE
ncbi:MAG: hypothetical protein ABH952_07045 [Candidatus Omnitrophota bacterium]